VEVRVCGQPGEYRIARGMGDATISLSSGVSRNAIDVQEAMEIVRIQQAKEQASASTQWSLGKLGESLNATTSVVGKLLWGEKYLARESSQTADERIDNVVEVASAGYSYGCSAKFYLLGAPLDISAGRGLNFVTVVGHGLNLKVDSSVNFDTCKDVQAVSRMVEWIDAVTPGAIVLIACKDSASGGTWCPDATAAMAEMDVFDALQSLGGSGTPFKFREAFACVGVKGGSAKESRSENGPVRLVVTLAELNQFQAASGTDFTAPVGKRESTYLRSRESTAASSAGSTPVKLVQSEGYSTVRIYSAPRNGSHILCEVSSHTRADLHEQCYGSFEQGSFCKVTVRSAGGPGGVVEGWVGAKNVAFFKERRSAII